MDSDFFVLCKFLSLPLLFHMIYISLFQDNYTALHIAVEHCKPLAIQTLLGFGAQVELKGGAVSMLATYSSKLNKQEYYFKDNNVPSRLST